MASRNAKVGLAAALTIGGLLAAGFVGRAWAEPQAQAAPSYVYGHGPQGLGYYLVPAPAQAQAAPRAAAAPRTTAATPPRRHREFGTGRSVPLAKPWLNQFK